MTTSTSDPQHEPRRPGRRRRHRWTDPASIAAYAALLTAAGSALHGASELLGPLLRHLT